MSSVSISEARAALPELLDRVSKGEEIVITRHGRRTAVLVRPDALRVRRADVAFAEAERLRVILDRGRTVALDDGPTVSAERIDDLLGAVADSRDER